MLRVLSLAAALLLPSLAHAAAWPDLSAQIQPIGEGRNDAAVIIAVEDYLRVDDVTGARSNADAWMRWFVNGRGVSASRVFKAVDGEATDVKIRALAKSAAAAVQPGGTLWFVFIGHGAPSIDGRDGLLVGADAERSADGLYARSVSRTELLALLDAGPQAQTVALLDACFSGQSPSGTAIVPDLQPLIPTALTQTVSDRARVLTAAGSGEFSGPLNGAARPAFSYLALGGLMGWADVSGDGNQDGRVTAAELRGYVHGALNLTVSGRSQTPALLGADADLGRAVARNAPDLLAMVAPAAAPPPPPPAPAAPAAPIGPIDRDNVYGGYIARSDLVARSPNPLRFRKAELPAVGDRVGCGREADALRRATGRKTAKALTKIAGIAVGPAMIATATLVSSACGGADCSTDTKTAVWATGGAGIGVSVFAIAAMSSSTSDSTSGAREDLLSCMAGADRSLLDPR
jgi:hypothetical protein